MKTSKIIFIVFFSLVGLFLLSFIIQYRPLNKGNNRNHFEDFDLPPFSHLVIRGNTSVTLNSSDSIRIRFWHVEGKYGDSTLWGKYYRLYSLQNDTLIVDCPVADTLIMFELSTNGLKSIDIQKGNLTLQNLRGDELTLTAQGSHLDLREGLVFRKSIELNLSDNVKLFANLFEPIPMLNVKLIQSEAHFFTSMVSINQLNAMLFENSELITTGVRIAHRNVQTDTTSKYQSH